MFVDRFLWLVKFLIFLPAAVIIFAIIVIAAILGTQQLHYAIKYLVKPVFNIFFPIQIKGEENIPESGGVILAGNHTGVIDSAVIEIAAKRPVTFFMASWIEKLFIIGFIAKKLRNIPVSPKKLIKALDETARRLQNNEVFCIFPEGQPTPDGKVHKFEKGVAYLHKKSGAPVVPFAIHGGYEAWSWRVGLPNFRKVIICFGEPYSNLNQREQVIADQLQEKVRTMKRNMEYRECDGLEVQDYEDFLALMQKKFNENASLTALSFKKENELQSLTYGELTRQSVCLADYFIELGVQKNDRIGILSESRPEWGVIFFASAAAGAITVPLDNKLSYEELKPLVLNCKPSVICASPDFKETAKKLMSEIPEIQHVFVIGETEFQRELDSYNLKEFSKQKNTERGLDETLLIIYTSGTTGRSKGVMVTFRNIISQLKDFDKIFEFAPRESLISVLPLTHLLEITVGFITMLYKGAEITYIKKFQPKEFIKIMQQKKITRLIVVPEFLKILKISIEKDIKKSGKLAQGIFQTMFAVSKFIPSISLRQLMFYKIYKNFGGNIKEIISGGAPLDNEIAEFFFRLGIPVYQGYGLTETGPVVSGNTQKYNRIGSVGRTLPDVEIKFSKENEILVKGPNVMKGYYEKPELTQEVFDENGWFHTGDRGKLDKDGYLYITGRLKNIIVLSGGDKVQSEEVEAVLSESPMIKEPCVVGTNNKNGAEQVVAIVVPTDEAKDRYQHNGKELNDVINQEVARLTKSLSVYKRPAKVVLRTEDLPKTTTGKIKRKDVLDWYENQN